MTNRPRRGPRPAKPGSRSKLPVSPLKTPSEEVDTVVGPPSRSGLPPPSAQRPPSPQKFDENDDTQMGLPTPSGLPAPVSVRPPASHKFDENDETRTGLPTPADLPPPGSKKPASSHKFSDDAPTRELPMPDPQDAVDPDEAVTQIAPPSHRK